MGWRDLEDFRDRNWVATPAADSQMDVPAAAETPIESYAREGKLMTGCLFGAKYQTKKVHGKVVHVLDERKQRILLIKCGKLPAKGSDYCPMHKMQMDAKEAARPSGVA